MLLCIMPPIGESDSPLPFSPACFPSGYTSFERLAGLFFVRKHHLHFTLVELEKPEKNHDERVGLMLRQGTAAWPVYSFCLLSRIAHLRNLKLSACNDYTDPRPFLNITNVAYSPGCDRGRG